ncbi:MAG: folylpolyglutamate synthase/dihydrofolate synthase family protein [Bacteroidota bacterium]
MAEKFSTYQDALSFLYAQLPMYQRQGGKAFKPGLDNIKRLLAAIGHPEQKYPCVHIAGTNGKGSTSHMIAAVLQASGLKVGMYTSPHYVDFRERMKINGALIPEQTVLDFTNQRAELMERIQPSYFELTVAMAFDYFAQESVDVAVIETGLGGLLDSTNVVDPLLSVITNIGFDHMDVLGDTLPEIAFQKAGIIKPERPVVIGVTHPETEAVFRKVAKENASSINFADQLLEMTLNDQQMGTMNLDVEQSGAMLFSGLQVQAAGAYQIQNLRTAIQSLLLLKPHFTLTEEAFRNGFMHLKSLTYFVGRWQILAQQPLIITDSGHNVDGVALAMEQLQSYEYDQLHLVIGFSQGKEHEVLLKLFPTNATFYWTQPSVPRALPVTALENLTQAAQLSGTSYPNVQTALQAALYTANPKDLIFIGGSSFMVADVLALDLFADQ